MCSIFIVAKTGFGNKFPGSDTMGGKKTGGGEGSTAQTVHIHAMQTYIMFEKPRFRVAIVKIPKKELFSKIVEIELFFCNTYLCPNYTDRIKSINQSNKTNQIISTYL